MKSFSAVYWNVQIGLTLGEKGGYKYSEYNQRISEPANQLLQPIRDVSLNSA